MKPTKLSILFALFMIYSFTSNAQKLYVGANYHPHDDKNIDKVINAN